MDTGPEPLPRLMVLSAADARALATLAGQVGDAVAESPALPVTGLAASLMARPAGPCRLAFTAASAARAAGILLDGAGQDGAGQDGARQGVATGVAGQHRGPVAFLFPGVGDHCPGMAAGLYLASQRFREIFDECAELVRQAGGADLRALIESPGRRSQADGPRPRIDLAALMSAPNRPPWLDRAQFAQPATFVVEYALACLLREAGLGPDVLLGYSVGEYVAAVVAGVLPLGDMITVIVRRAELIEATPPGGMLVVLRGAQEVTSYLDAAGCRGVVVGAFDSDGMCVLSGPLPAIDEVQRVLTDDGVATRRLPARQAFHSPLLALAEARLRAVISELRLAEPSIAMLSNLTGGWLEGTDAVDPAYWARHMSQPVRFDENLDVLMAEVPSLVVEAGPGRMLGSLAAAHPGRPAGCQLISALPGPGQPAAEQVAALLMAFGQAWVAGAPVDLRAASDLFSDPAARPAA